MLTTNITDLSSLDALNSKVELYHDSTLIQACTCADFLESFSIDREGDTSKFFGFGVVHKMTCTLIDINRVLTLSTGDTVKVAYGNEVENEWDYPYPTFYITEHSRDEKNNTITFTAYDKLYFASAHNLDEIKNELYDATVGDVAYWCARALGLAGYDTTQANTSLFSYRFIDAAGGINFNGDEDLRTVLNAVAEFTGNIYYTHNPEYLCFKALNRTGDAVVTINKDAYYELNIKEPAVLKNISSVTELGENLTPPTTIDEGYTQYLKENAFLTSLDSVTTAGLVETIAGLVQETAITQFDCDWEGNHLIEIGDKIGVVGTDGAVHYTYLLNDKIAYSGYLNQITSWEYTQDTAETATNTTSLGDRLNETYAKVNKLEKNITLYVSEAVDNVLTEQLEEVLPGEIEEATSGLVEDIKDLTKTTTSHTNSISQLVVQTGNISSEVSALTETTTNITDDIGTILNSQTTIEEQVASLQIETDNVTTTVKEVQQSLGDKADKDTVETLTKQVETKVTSEQVEFIVTSELADGIDKVTTTSKRYTFDDEGLNISSSNSNISTTITEDGMNIKRQGEEVLVADNEGVKAEDLHATTYLIIGNNSRFEDYTNSVGEARTACFWIGG